jgi:hypothetical protein
MKKLMFGICFIGIIGSCSFFQSDEPELTLQTNNKKMENLINYSFINADNYQNYFLSNSEDDEIIKSILQYNGKNEAKIFTDLSNKITNVNLKKRMILLSEETK